MTTAVTTRDLKHAAVMRIARQSGAVEHFATGAEGRRLRTPNAIAFDAEGRLYVGCHEPSQILRVCRSCELDAIAEYLAAGALAVGVNGGRLVGSEPAAARRGG